MSSLPESTPAGFARHRLIGLFAGPLFALSLALSPTPEGLSQEGWWTAAVGLLMAIWWMTEALPLAVTALAPLILFPLLEVRSIDDTAASYAHPLVLLFLGGFLLARAMQVWGLDRRIALGVVRLAGTDPRRLIAGIMGVTAFLSMWVSNTATSMVMLPIALSILSRLSAQDQEGGAGFAPALLLGVAYAATIGGMGTLVGTPPNALFAAYMAESHGIDIGFAQWMTVGVPVAFVMLLAAWFVLTHLAFRVDGKLPPATSSAEPVATERITIPERSVAAILALVALFWIFSPLLKSALPRLHLSDAGIAITGAFLLFLIPADLRRGRFLLHWSDAAGIRWDVLILFGGGLALAAAIAGTDLTPWLARQLTGLGAWPTFALLLTIGIFVVFLGELASNTAMAAVFLPLAGASALAVGEPVVLLALPVALFATLGFMLPVATPPNAVIFGSGAIKMGDMLRAGIVLDIVGIAVVAAGIYFFGDALFGNR